MTRQSHFFIKDPLYKFNHSPHSPHSIISTLITPSSHVLDVGCNGGLLAKEIISKQVVTDGIDISPSLLKHASRYCRQVYQRDLNLPQLKLAHRQHSYDFIIFSDVLEHLPYPDLLLIDCRKYLKKSGQVIVSLPNIARIEIRLKLLLGHFDYYPGILSSDHLRFFTQESAVRLFRHCGFSVTKIIPTGLGHMIGVFPNLTAFQFVYVLT